MEKTIEQVEAELVALQNKVAIMEAQEDGVKLVLSEKSGKFSINRDYNKGNKKFNRLSR